MLSWTIVALLYWIIQLENLTELSGSFYFCCFMFLSSCRCPWLASVDKLVYYSRSQQPVQRCWGRNVYGHSDTHGHADQLTVQGLYRFWSYRWVLGVAVRNTRMASGNSPLLGWFDVQMSYRLKIVPMWWVKLKQKNNNSSSSSIILITQVMPLLYWYLL